MKSVAVLGAGSWGTTLANLLARQEIAIRLWAYEQEVVDSINSRHLNDVFLADCHGCQAANPADSRSFRIDSRNPAIWFQLGMLRHAYAARRDRRSAFRKKRLLPRGDAQASPRVLL